MAWAREGLAVAVAVTWAGALVAVGADMAVVVRDL